MNSRRPPSLQDVASPFSISLRDVTLRRHAGVECHELKVVGGEAIHQACVAVPASYDTKTRRRYSLVVLLNACEVFGSAVEMSRLMAQTREINECIVIALETPIATMGDVQRHLGFVAGEFLPWCRDKYRVAPGPATVFSGITGIAEALARSVGTDELQALQVESGIHDQADPLPTLVSGLRRAFATGHRYGSELVMLGNPLVSKILGVLQPVIGRLRSRAADVPRDSGPNVIRAQGMGRDFEVFAVLPASAARNPGRRYPALLALDANIELSTVAEAAARMARLGEIEEIIVIGIGVPRSQGPLEFGFRRFEEFSPPPDGYRFDDRLGRIFRSLFATCGKDARQCVGEARQLYGFLVDELLPMLGQQLPVDTRSLGLLGHSAGGTFVCYALCQEQSPFQHYVSISPGVGMSGSWLLREPQASRPLAGAARRVFFGLGGEEKTNVFCQIAGIHHTEALSRQVRTQQPGLDVTFQCFDGETHSSIFPRAVTDSLRSLYGAARSR